MWPGEIRQEETGGWYQIRSLYWPLRAKLLSFCSGAGNGGAASGAKSQNTLDSFFLLLLFVKKQSAACFLHKSRLFSRQRSRLCTSQDVRAAPIQKKTVCLRDTDSETLSDNSEFVDWHRQNVVDVLMVAKAQCFKSHFNKERNTVGLERQIFCCNTFVYF